MTSLENILENAREDSHNPKKKIEKKISESEEKYKLISENANDLIRIMNDRFEFEYINEKVHRRLLGYSKEEMISKMSLQFIHPDYWKTVVKSTRKYLKGEKSPYELQFKCKDGSLRWFEIKAKVLHNSKGEMKILSIARDINDKKLAELKLRESEEKYRLISETAYDLIGVLNSKFKYEYINENAFLQILGYTKEDLIGKSTLKFIHPEDVSTVANALFKGFKEGAGGAELRFLHKSGDWVWIEAKGQRYTDVNDELKAIIISRDVTKRKLSEQKVKESERKYRQLYNQLRFYKDLFTHDISNILHVIRSSTELLSFHLSDKNPKVVDDLINIIDKQVDRGNKLMSNAYTLSELEDSEISIRNINLCEVLEDSIDYIKKVNEQRNVEIEVDCENIKKELYVKASYLLQDIFDNVLTNAIKYNNSPKVEINIRVSSIIEDGIKYYKIQFIDNGIGISDEKKELIFESGNRELKGSKGMGLGLSIVKKILDSYDGKIKVKNRIKNDYSQGTNFILLLREISTDFKK